MLPASPGIVTIPAKRTSRIPCSSFLVSATRRRNRWALPSLKYAYLPDCPGRAYWKALSTGYIEADAHGVATRQSLQPLRHDFDAGVIQALGFSEPVQVEASPFVTAQIARVDGKVHIFLFNFGGLQPLKISKQIPEKNIAVSFPASVGSRIFLLPYLGTARELSVEHKDGRIRAIIPEIDKGATVWIE